LLLKRHDASPRLLHLPPQCLDPFLRRFSLGHLIPQLRLDRVLGSDNKGVLILELLMLDLQVGQRR
jgi:hypothetical protein